jgi:hypothetical protein
MHSSPVPLHQYGLTSLFVLVHGTHSSGAIESAPDATE